jgi:gentisate 1,2-dioxygenase
MPVVALGAFGSELHANGPSRVIPLDLSQQLHCTGPASSPTLSANFIRILPGEHVETSPNATSQLFYVIRGAGETSSSGAVIAWQEGDIFTLPMGAAHHAASKEAALYWVHDEPLLRYLGVQASEPKFKPTLYSKENLDLELNKVKADPEASKRSRISVLLANQHFPQSNTITHVLWAMYGILPANTVQLPHRHQSIALDLIIDAPMGCYTLLGEKINSAGEIINPIKADWKTASAFVTPPGWWHAHYNESDRDAYLLPIQDAGLQTYMRTLDIQFYQANHK